MPSRKKRLKKQLESLRERLDEHYQKFEEDLDKGRLSIQHHRHEIDTLKRDIAAKRALLRKGKKRNTNDEET